MISESVAKKEPEPVEAQPDDSDMEGRGTPVLSSIWIG